MAGAGQILFIQGGGAGAHVAAPVRRGWWMAR